MKESKARIDKAGSALSKDTVDEVDEYFALEDVFDDYRKSHLQPLTETTLELQQWLTEYGGKYYIAQRLKRKPQIIRKLQRFSVRLTQLQDIGGCRIIVDSNKDVDNLFAYLLDRLDAQDQLKLDRTADYRERGRDDTGYRALHLIFTGSNRKLELQLRSRIQHYWAESIERTSVIYGYHLKEGEGHGIVLEYFRKLSDIFFEMEAGREPSSVQKIEIDQLRDYAEDLIKKSDKNRIFDSYVNDDIIKTLAAVEAKRATGFNNWLIVFDWNTGAFISWDIVDRDPEAAIKIYVEKENQFPAGSGYEVVLIGSSDVATVKQTHSHYFGIDSYDNILEGLEQAVVGFNKRMDIDTDARRILLCMHRKNFWGSHTVSAATLKNHICKNILGFDSALKLLSQKGLIIMPSLNGPLSLNLKLKAEIERYL